MNSVQRSRRAIVSVYSVEESGSVVAKVVSTKKQEGHRLCVLR